MGGGTACAKVAKAWRGADRRYLGSRKKDEKPEENVAEPAQRI
jgi:hypothetical protein